MAGREEPLTSSGILDAIDHACPGTCTPTPRKLSSLNRTHLLCPSSSRLRTPDGPNLIAAEAGNPDVVLSFEYELDIADVESSRTTQLRQTAGSSDEIVNEIVCNLEEYLSSLVRICIIFQTQNRGSQVLM